MNLYEKLTEYKDRDYYPMHMPGHKRNLSLLSMVNPYSIDITEIEDFDNLHHATGILLEGMEKCATLYGSDHTDYLIGGSTAGILTAISASTRKNDKILVARNSHKSVYHAIYLNELDPVYLYPEVLPEFGINGGIRPQAVEEMLIKYPDIKLVVITSPTYEGIVSDICRIANVAHQYGIPVMVDEAHGAHFGFHKGFPPNSVSLGADLVIHSIHKTLPAFTQTALIHTNGNLVNYEEIKRYLSIYQTSSPSYILMAGMEQCIGLLKEKREELFEIFHKRLEDFYLRMEGLENLNILNPVKARQMGCFDFDPSKIIVSTQNKRVTGKFLYDQLLNSYHIQMEMAAGDFVLGMTSIADTEDGFKRLGDALLEMDANLKKRQWQQVTGENPVLPNPPKKVLLCHEVYEKTREVVPLTESAGRISAEYIYLYPPGIPLLVPGERISSELLAKLHEYQDKGLTLQGLIDKGEKFIRVCQEV